MVWNVYYYNLNKRQIEIFNIFEHWKFNEEVQKDLSRYRNREEFATRLKSNLVYYFWSKSEWEVLVSPWTSSDEQSVIKIDVCDQVMLNFEAFLDYVWTHRGV